MEMLGRGDRIKTGAAIGGSLVTGVLDLSGANAVLVFVVAAISLALLATIVGQATEQLGARLGPGATGVLQSGLGNLPELLISIFAIRAGLIPVVQAAIVGSILGNSLLVLGLAFTVGGLRHGTQRFSSEPPRMIATLMLLAVSALMVPTIAHNLHTPASQHEDALSIAGALVLLAVFIVSIPASLSGGPATPQPPEESKAHWPMWLTLVMLAIASIAAAFVSEWFVSALTPAITALHLSEAFTGLVVVAIAGNAVENVVGVQLAARNQPDYAISVILNSPLQVALALTPVLVLLSFVLGGPHLTLVMPTLLVVALALAAIIGAVVVFDGQSVWLEGVALIALYGIIATAFWWG